MEAPGKSKVGNDLSFPKFQISGFSRAMFMLIDHDRYERIEKKFIPHALVHLFLEQVILLIVDVSAWHRTIQVLVQLIAHLKGAIQQAEVPSPHW